MYKYILAWAGAITVFANWNRIFNLESSITTLPLCIISTRNKLPSVWLMQRKINNKLK